MANSTKFYTPFGEYRIQPPDPTDDITDRGFTGHRHNDELELIYMNARYFLPATGRFISADTIIPNPADPQSHNRYSYVRNNALNAIDPTGHIDCPDPDAGCAPATTSPPDIEWNQETVNQLIEDFAESNNPYDSTDNPYWKFVLHSLLEEYDYAAQNPWVLEDENWFEEVWAASIEFANTMLAQAMAADMTLGEWWNRFVVGGNMLTVSVTGTLFVSSGFLSAKATSVVDQYLRSLRNYAELGFTPGSVIPGSQAHYPPGWNDSWKWLPSSRSGGTFHWWDPNGGEWRWHAPDRWHQYGHWDYNPWTSWNSLWQNIPETRPFPPVFP